MAAEQHHPLQTGETASGAMQAGEVRSWSKSNLCWARETGEQGHMGWSQLKTACRKRWRFVIAGVGRRGGMGACLALQEASSR